MSLDAALPDVVAAVRAAARRIEEARRARLDVRFKGTAGPVTTADREADRFLRARLPEIVPAAWLSEETADAPARLEASRVWVVDPLDGTRELLAGIPEYAVSAALVEDGRPVLGVVAVPPTGVAWWALRGRGAFREGHPAKVAEGGRLLASRTEVAAGELEPFAGTWTVEPVGSIAHKLARVASGEAGLTLSRGPKAEWDVCAGTLLVEEAGGVATDLAGRPLRFNRARTAVAGIVAGAPGCHRRALEQLERGGPAPRMAALGVTEDTDREERRGP